MRKLSPKRGFQFLELCTQLRLSLPMKPGNRNSQTRPLSVIFPCGFNPVPPPFTSSVSLTKSLDVKEWAGWRIHGFEGCLDWIQLLKTPGKISKQPPKQTVFLSPSSLVITMKNKLSGVGSGTSWLAWSIAERTPKKPAQSKAEECLPYKPRLGGRIGMGLLIYIHAK